MVGTVMCPKNFNMQHCVKNTDRKVYVKTAAVLETYASFYKQMKMLLLKITRRLIIQNQNRYKVNKVGNMLLVDKENRDEEQRKTQLTLMCSLKINTANKFSQVRGNIGKSAGTLARKCYVNTSISPRLALGSSF